jgi:hypothetical protein
MSAGKDAALARAAGVLYQPNVVSGALACEVEALAAVAHLQPLVTAAGILEGPLLVAASAASHWTTMAPVAWLTPFTSMHFELDRERTRIMWDTAHGHATPAWRPRVAAVSAINTAGAYQEIFVA